MYVQEQEPRRRRDAGILQVTERDILALSWIAEQFTISFDHLQSLLGRHPKAETKAPGVLSPSATRNALLRWLQLGLIEEPRKVIREHPPYVWLSRRGLAQLGLPYPYYLPKPSTVRHIYAANTVRLRLETLNLRSYWYAERLLSRETSERPLPDAELRMSNLPYIAIKVLERPFRLDVTLHDELIALQALTHRKQIQGSSFRYSQLWYFVHNDAVPMFRDTVAALHSQVQQRIILYGLDAQPATGEQTPLDGGEPTISPPT